MICSMISIIKITLRKTQFILEEKMSNFRSRVSRIIMLAAVLVMACPLFAFAEEAAEEPALYATWWAVVPPVAASCLLVLLSAACCMQEILKEH